MRSFKYKSKMFLSILSVFCVLSVTVVVVLDFRIRPMLYNLAQNEAKKYALIIINQSVTEVLSENSDDLNNVTNISTDETGRPTYLSVNATQVDKVVSEIFANIHKKVGETDKVKCSVNLGTITKSAYLYGKGPEFNIIVQISQYINYEIISAFSDAGINQTKNSLYLKLTATIFAVMPGDKRKETVSNEYLLSETIIVGNVPDGYTEVIQVGSSEFDTADTLVNFGQ